MLADIELELSDSHVLQHGVGDRVRNVAPIQLCGKSVGAGLSRERHGSRRQKKPRVRSGMSTRSNLDVFILARGPECIPESQTIVIAVAEVSYWIRGAATLSRSDLDGKEYPSPTEALSSWTSIKILHTLRDWLTGYL